MGASTVQPESLDDSSSESHPTLNENYGTLQNHNDTEQPALDTTVPKPSIDRFPYVQLELAAPPESEPRLHHTTALLRHGEPQRQLKEHHT